MTKKEDDDLIDVRKEEISRGKRVPKRAISLELERRIRRAARMLEEHSNYTEAEFIEAIRAIGLRDGSIEFERCLKEWRKK